MKYKIPIRVVELEPNNYHLIIQSEFGAGQTLNWVIDTGASKTAFDKNLADFYELSEHETEELHTAGIGDKQIETSIGHLKKFTIGKLAIVALKVALLDLSHVNKLYKKSTNLEICGLLGSDFLMKHKATIDYKKAILILNN